MQAKIKEIRQKSISKKDYKIKKQTGKIGKSKPIKKDKKIEPKEKKAKTS